MNVIMIGPSDIESQGGMATVIHQMRESELINNSDYDVVFYPTFIDGNRITRILYCMKQFAKFFPIRNNYDIYHIHVAAYHSTIRKRLYTKLIDNKKKIIIHIHGSQYEDYYESLDSNCKKKISAFLNDCGAVIALSPKLKDLFEKRMHVKNCYVLSNGIKIEDYLLSRTDHNITHNNFLFLGRMGKRKGVYDLIEAIKIVAKKNPNVHLTIAGDGEKEIIEKRVLEQNLMNNISILGWQTKQEAARLLRDSSTLVLPSYNEGLPMAILEAMAAGKAIISTYVGGIPDLINPSNGKLIKPGDVIALAAAIESISADVSYLQRVGENNMNKIASEYNIKEIHRSLLGIYDAVVDGNVKQGIKQ